MKLGGNQQSPSLLLLYPTSRSSTRKKSVKKRLLVGLIIGKRIKCYVSTCPTNDRLRCRRHGLLNILKLQAAFCIQFNYHQQAGKTSLFHMRGSISRILILAVPLTYDY